MQTAVFALLGLASLLAGFIFRLVMPGLRYYAWGILAIGVALLAVGVILDFRKVKGALGSKRGKFGVGTTVKISLFCGIILLVNAVSAGTFYRFDFTGLAQFTLTSQTKEVLAELDEPVEIVNFFTPVLPPAITGYARDLLAEYQKYTDQLTVREIDPELNPEQARQYGIAGYGSLFGEIGGITVVGSDEGQRHIYGFQIYAEAEHAFTSAILEVTGTLQNKVYFLTGHGESSIADDYLNAYKGLRDNLLQVGELDLLRVAGIPSDAAALIMAGPQADLVSSELDILRDYLQDGGRLFVLLNPNPPERLKALLAEWTIGVPEGMIIDPSSYVAPNQDTPLVPRTGNFFGLTEIYFPGAAALLPTGEVPENIEISPIVWTSQASWLELSDFSDRSPKFDKETEVRSTMIIGVLVSTIPEEGNEDSIGTRIAVLGDSDFAATQHFQNGNNSDLFLSAINWLIEGEEISGPKGSANPTAYS